MQEQIRSYLSQAELFSGLNERQLNSLSKLAIIKRFQKGELVFAEGSAAREFFMVVRGKVKVVKYSLHGKEQVLHVFEDFQPVGEVAVFLNSTFPANCVALSDTDIIQIRRLDFVGLIKAEPEMGLRLLAVLAQRLHDFSKLISSMTLTEAPARLARFLLELMEKGTPGSIVLQLPFSKLELAKVLGITPETLSRTLNRFKQEGLIAMERRQLKILNRKSLAALAELD